MLISVDVAFDVIEKAVLMQIPELSGQFIDYNIEDLYDDEMDDTFETWEMMVKAEDKRPSAAAKTMLKQSLRFSEKVEIE